MTKRELLLLRRALKHYVNHQLGTIHPETIEYEDMIKRIEDNLGIKLVSKIE